MFKILLILMANQVQAPTLVGHVSPSLIAEPEQPTVQRPGLGFYQS